MASTIDRRYYLFSYQDAEEGLTVNVGGAAEVAAMAAEEFGGEPGGIGSVADVQAELEEGRIPSFGIPELKAYGAAFPAELVGDDLGAAATAATLALLLPASTDEVLQRIEELREDGGAD